MWDGIASPWRGLRHLARHPASWPLVVVPVVLTAVLFVGALALAWWLVPILMGWLWSPGPQHSVGIHLLYAFIANLARALAFLTVGVTMYFTAGLVAVPFNDQLSAQVEAESGRLDPVPFHWSDVPTSIAHSALSLGLWLGVLSVLWVLEAVPVLGSLLHVGLSLGATGLLLGREMMDGAMSRRRWRFRRKLHFVWDHRTPVLGFGLTASVLLSVPFLNALCLPVVVAGGTLLFLDLTAEGDRC